MMKDEAAKVFYKAIWTAERNWPDSLLAELLTKFSTPTVAKLIRLYSGQQLQIPYEDDIWKTYRNRKIREALDENGDTATRNKMARLFGVSRLRVSAIYREEKKKFPSTRRAAAKKAAKNIYAKELRIVQKEVTKVSSNRL